VTLKAESSTAVEGAQDADTGDVATRLAQLRRLRGLTLAEVADRSALSESFLSQVERGRANPSIASLKRIVTAMGASMADLFQPVPTPGPRVLAASDRPCIAFGVLGKKYLVTPKPLKNLEVFIAELQVGGSTGEELYSHGDSEEMFMVLSGRVQMQIRPDVFEMRSRDSIRFRSSTPHGVVNVGTEPAEVMWVISPPSF
jgi:transcriptional regulator with XRE-family HTH domain